MSTGDNSTQVAPLLGMQKDAQVKRLADRPRSLSGVRLGLLSNGKPNAGLLLQAFGYRLADLVGLGDVRLFEKQDFGETVEESVVLRIRETCDVVIAGVGD